MYVSQASGTSLFYSQLTNSLQHLLSHRNQQIVKNMNTLNSKMPINQWYQQASL